MLALLDAVFFQPLFLIYSAIYESMPESMTAGTRLIMFSLLINLALLPVYNQMEKHSRKLRDVKDRVERDVDRMRRNFTGRERFFYVRAVYRQYRYHPLSALFGSFDLFLQVLVFVTVYRYLSGLESLYGQPYGVVADLARPDALLGGVNLLPLLMTAINALSVFAYVDDRRKRMQAIILAGIFLVLLYGSSSGLVLYWTANNMFSLMRNVVQRRVSLRLPATLTRRLTNVATLQ